MDGQMDGRTDGWMDRWMDGNIGYLYAGHFVSCFRFLINKKINK